MNLSSNTVSLFLPPLVGGGTERVMLNLAQSLTERGLKIDLVLPETEGPHRRYMTRVPSELRVIDLKSPRSPVVFVSKLLALRRYLRQERPAVMVASLDYASVSTWARCLAGVNTRILMCVHTNISHEFNNNGVKGKLKPYLIQWFYPWADRIVAVSQGVAEDVARISGLPLEKIRVIYNPVVTPDLFEKAKEPVDHPWFAPGEPPVILGAGRLAYQKDFPTLIRAFALVRQHRPVRLMILGQEGDKRPQLEALVRELGVECEVALPGFAENLYAYMGKAAVFVLSSVYEGFGNVLAEAMAAGTSVVSTDCDSGPAEILSDGKYGRLVPVGDVDALADAILATLSNPTDPELLRQRAGAFSVERIVDQYVEVLNSVTKQG